MTDFARSFGAVADEYDRLRPDYPDAAIDAALPPSARRVVDVGAGTGKLTSALLRHGLSVIAVEPDPQMRQILAVRATGADVRDGVAERLPVDDRSSDAVLFAQSWHWADPDQAAAEAVRVLRPDGCLSMLWNLHDDRVPWVAELLRLTGSTAAFTQLEEPPRLPGFAPAEVTLTPWRQPLGDNDVVGLAATWSGVSTLPAEEREAKLERVRALAADQAPTDLPYVCLNRRFALEAG